ncbi:MAG: hypothetical protein ABI665_11465 [Vicinamibacterales bacterium]
MTSDAPEQALYFFMSSTGDELGNKLASLISITPDGFRPPLETFAKSIRSIMGVLNLPVFLALPQHWSSEAERLNMSLLIQAKTLVVKKQLSEDGVSAFIEEKLKQHHAETLGNEATDVPAAIRLLDRAVQASWRARDARAA